MWTATRDQDHFSLSYTSSSLGSTEQHLTADYVLPWRSNNLSHQNKEKSLELREKKWDRVLRKLFLTAKMS